jgi:hypothetical protein
VKVLSGSDRSLDAHALRELRLHVAAELGSGIVDDRRSAAHERGRDRGALPQVVVSGLGHRGPESALELCLERHDLLPLALEAPVVGKMKVDLDQADEAQESSRST